MKKILLSFLLLLVSMSFMVSFDTYAVDDNPCGVNSITNIGKALDDCLDGSYLVDGSGDMDVEKGVKEQIITWTTAISAFLGLLAVGFMAYGGLLMVLSGGDEEKIKKGKDTVKWVLLGFLLLVFGGVLVRVLIELVFSVAR